MKADFSQVARSIRAAALYTLLALLFSTAIEFDSCTTKADSDKLAPKTKPSKKDSSTKTNKQPKEAEMQNLKTLTMRIKVGGSKVVLALAGVRRQS